jgi:Putative addiction module component
MMRSLGIDQLSVTERILLVEEIWASIVETPEQIPLTEAETHRSFEHRFLYAEPIFPRAMLIESAPAVVHGLACSRRIRSSLSTINNPPLTM